MGYSQLENKIDLAKHRLLNLIFLPSRLILGMMLTTSFLSMWLSNTASTAMMLPIAIAILKSLFGDKEASEDLNRENGENQGSSHRTIERTIWGQSGSH